MKRLYLSLTALLLSATMMADEKLALVVSYGAGEEAVIFLDTQPVITIADGKLVVTPALGESTQIPLSHTLSYSIAMRDPQAVGISPTDGITISRSASTITVSGAKDIKLYNAAGTLLVSAKGKSTIDLSHYAAGSYILTVNNKTYKIAR